MGTHKDIDVQQQENLQYELQAVFQVEKDHEARIASVMDLMDRGLDVCSNIGGSVSDLPDQKSVLHYAIKDRDLVTAMINHPNFVFDAGMTPVLTQALDDRKLFNEILSKNTDGTKIKNADELASKCQEKGWTKEAETISKLSSPGLKFYPKS